MVVQYLLKFDQDVVNKLNDKTDLNIKDRIVTFGNNNTYTMHDVEWIINKKSVNNKIVMNIDAQNIIIYTYTM